ncbi:MAG: hypothetical protein ACYDAG_03280 [Chloroflexota bacterium]
MKVPPERAVEILATAGLSASTAERAVTDIIRRRTEAVPALAGLALPGVVPAALVRSVVGSPDGPPLTRVLYGEPDQSPRRKPNLDRLALLHKRLGDRYVPLERYLHEGRP